MAKKPSYRDLERRVAALESELAQTRQKMDVIHREKTEVAAVLANLPLLILIVDGDRRVRKVSNAVLRFLGAEESELLGLRSGEALRCIHHLDDPKGCGFGAACATCEIRKIVKETLSTGKTHHQVEVALSIMDDVEEKRIFRISSMALENGGGRNALVFIEDITGQKQVEVSLEESRQRAGLLFSHTPIMIHSVNPEGRLLEVNEHWLKKMGFTREEVLGRRSVEFMTPETQRFVDSELRSDFFRTGGVRKVPMQLVTRHGKVLETLCSAKGGYNDRGEVAYSLAVFEDITRRLEMERALKKSEEQYRLLFRQSPVGVVHTDMNGVVIDVNDSFARIIGADRDQLIGFNVFEDVKDLEMLQAVHNSLKGEGSHFRGDYTSAVSGKKVSINGSIRGLRDKDGLIIGGIATFEDITEQIEAEKRLKKSEALLNEMGKMAKVGGWEVDVETLNVGWTKETYRIHGVLPGTKLTLEEAILFFHPDDRPKLREAVRLALEEGRRYDLELRLITAEGRQLWARSICIPEMSNGAAVRLMGAFQDITEKKQLEELMLIQRDLGLALGMTGELEEALDVSLAAALKISGIDWGGIYMVDPGSGEMSLAIHESMPSEIAGKEDFRNGHPLLTRVVANGKPAYLSYEIFLASLKLSPGQLALRKKAGLRSVAVVPVIHDGKVIAVLKAVSGDLDRIPAFSRYSLETVAAQISGALARIKTSRELAVSRQNFKTLFDNLDDFVFVLDSTGKITNFNRVVEKRLGYTSEELLEMNVLDMHPPERREEAADIVGEIVKGKTAYCPIPLLAKDGTLIPVETNATLGTWNNQEAIFGISRDISWRIEAEKARQLSEERLLAAIDAIDEGFVLFDSEDRLAMCNAKYIDIYKESKDLFVIGTPFEHILRESARRGQYEGSADRVEEWVAERMTRHQQSSGSFEQKLSNGRWMKISERKMKDGSIVGFRVDITDMKRSEEHIRQALKEKETLLREIHHRVKNNMQVVSSLLSLQAAKIDEKKSQAVFAEAEGRVHSMSLVHEILYQSDNFSEIDVRMYLENLTDQLFQVFASYVSLPEIKINADDVVFGIDQAVPCGLIVTELFTNAMKYAFPADKSGEIHMNIIYTGENEIEMTIADNGVGLPPEFDPKSSKNLGIQLVVELVESQLEGSWTLNTGQGVCWVIKWNVLNAS